MIIVVGAGPAGLAIAYELAQRDLPYRVLERSDRVGYAWHNHYDRLHLHTLKGVSALPGLPMPADYPDFPSAAQFRRYLADYAAHFELAIDCGVDVQHAEYNDEGWELQTNLGPLTCDTLIVATGIWSTPFTPQLPGMDNFGGTIIHAAAYRNPTPFAGQRVLVVGAGNSGSEIAVDLNEHGIETAVAIRSGMTFVPYPSSARGMKVASWALRHAPRSVGEWALRRVRHDFSDVGIPLPPHLIDAYPVVGFRLPDALREQRIALHSALVRFTLGTAHFADGSQALFDTVVMATGYRPSVQFIAPKLTLDAQGRPLVDKRWRSLENSHLFCVGLWYPSTEGWIQSIGRVAHDAAARVPATMTTTKHTVLQQDPLLFL